MRCSTNSSTSQKEHQRLRFNAADNIIDRKLFRTRCSALAGLHYDFHIFYEVKANMRKAEVAKPERGRRH